MSLQKHCKRAHVMGLHRNLLREYPFTSQNSLQSCEIEVNIFNFRTNN